VAEDNLKKIAVIGLGNWGTALAHHLATLGHDVFGWTRDASIVHAINLKHQHPHLLSDVTLATKLIATIDLAHCSQADYLVYALPSATLAEIVPQLKMHDQSIFISAVKGLEATTMLTPLQYVQQVAGAQISTVVLSGPSFAVDVIKQRPCGLVAASSNQESAKIVAQLFSGSGMRVYTSSDPIGVEFGSIVKNIIALAVGVCDGLNLGESARAGLITRGLAEMSRLAEAFGAQRATLSGLSGLGDLVLTATSSQSRNRTVGFRLGSGESLSNIINSLGSVAEAVKTTPIVMQLARSRAIDMPICQQVESLLLGNTKTSDLVQNLLGRPLKGE
jgi:glycerol-3-phosphate dehydrogenase (NAD(P)+)